MKQKKQPSSDADTRERIAVAALAVFAKNGFNSGTVREITEVANVNVAAINYHFQSKEGLIAHILEKGTQSIIRIRFGALDECLEKSKPALPTVEQLAEALVRPLVELGSGQYRDVMMLMMHARTTTSDFIIRIVEEQFAPLHEKFVDVLQKVLPELPRSEIAIRYDCARGAILQTLVSLAPAAGLVSGIHAITSLNHEKTVQRLVRFVAAGLSAAGE